LSENRDSNRVYINGASPAFAAYGWKSDLRDEEILEKLLALNLERAE